MRARSLSMGVDGVSVENFRKEEGKKLAKIYDSLEREVFVFSRLKSFSKPRGGGRKPREIQVPTVDDRIVQKVLNDYLAQKYCSEIFRSSNVVGSVKGNTVRNILKQILMYYKEGYIYVLKTDIIDYFPSINTERLKKMIAFRIDDKGARKLLFDYLRRSNSKGIAQGPPLSPLMANIYLLSLDKYLSQRKKIKHVRYVDDVLVFCKSEKEAKRVYAFLFRKYKKIGLNIHPLEKNSKTKIAKFNSGDIDALGVTFEGTELFIKKEKVLEFRHESIDSLDKVIILSRFKGNTNPEKLESLIESLNYKLQGWGNSYSFCDVGPLYQRLDENIARKIVTLCNAIGIHDDLTQRYWIQQVFKLSSIRLTKVT